MYSTWILFAPLLYGGTTVLGRFLIPEEFRDLLTFVGGENGLNELWTNADALVQDQAEPKNIVSTEDFHWTQGLWLHHIKDNRTDFPKVYVGNAIREIARFQNTPDVFLCRRLRDGEAIVGLLAAPHFAPNQICAIPWDLDFVGSIISKTVDPDFEILHEPLHSQYQWIDVLDGLLVNGAVRAGIKKDYKPIFICRVNFPGYQGVYLPGYIEAGSGRCNVTGPAHLFSSFQILWDSGFQVENE